MCVIQSILYLFKIETAFVKSLDVYPRQINFPVSSFEVCKPSSTHT